MNRATHIPDELADAFRPPTSAPADVVPVQPAILALSVLLVPVLVTAFLML